MNTGNGVIRRLVTTIGLHPCSTPRLAPVCSAASIMSYRFRGNGSGGGGHRHYGRGRGHGRGGGGARYRSGGGGHRHAFDSADSEAGSSASHQNGRGRGGRGGRHPAGLSGREIGMFYARRSQAKKASADMANRAEVKIKHSDAGYLRDLVNEESMEVAPVESVPTPRTDDTGRWAHRKLQKNAALDQDLYDAFHDKTASTEYKTMAKSRAKLPSFSRAEEIVKTIESNRVTVISGETGCGKTTQVPQFILDHYIDAMRGSECRIVCTQPRRISAITVAERVAVERADRCGDPQSSCGFQIRLETKFPRHAGSILYCTTGIVLKWLESDKDLSQISHLILDEVHERDLLTDFLMIVIKGVLDINPRIRIVLMSATLNAESFSRYYNHGAMIHIPGFTYPVEEYYMEEIVDWTNYTPRKEKRQLPIWRQVKKLGKSREQIDEEQRDFDAFLRHMSEKYPSKTVDALRNVDYEEVDIDLITRLIEHICRHKDDGAILVFLPGWEQISNVYKQLNDTAMFRNSQSQYLILPLHSMMPTVNQREVFERPPPGVRKIVLATNIAETSITIDDVVYVVDCGKIKMKNYDPQLNLTTLQPEWNSLANSRQRRGRAGRVQPGECYHLYTSYHESKLESYQKPEMLRTRLEELCLQIKLLHFGDIKSFVLKALDPPDERTLVQSIQLLKELNALDENEELTPLGHHLARLPVDPHAGKMILFGAMFACLDPILTIAASLSFKDAFVVPLGKESSADARKRVLSQGSKSDHLMLVNAFQGWERAKTRRQDSQYCWDNFLSASTLRMLENMKGQFCDLLYDSGFITSRDPKHGAANINSGNEKLVKSIICAGLYPNVAKVWTKQTKRGPVHSLTTKDGSKAKFHLKCVNNTEEDIGSQWIVYYLKMKTNGINIFDSTPVSPFPLLFFGGKIQFRVEDGHDAIVVDDWIKFKSGRETADLVKDLRVELDSLLNEKIRRPGVVEWGRDSREGRVIRAIHDLITKDY